MTSKLRISANALNRKARSTSAARSVPRSFFRLERQTWCVAHPASELESPGASGAGKASRVPHKTRHDASPKHSLAIELPAPRDPYSKLLEAKGLCVRCKAAPASSAGVCICCYMGEMADEGPQKT
jgi:hypothetical protein